MKVILYSLAIFLFQTQSFANDDKSHSDWISTNTVLISNSQSPEIARRDCQITMEILSLMSNDKIVFKSRCEPTRNPRCNYYFCYELSVKALVIDRH